MLSSLSKPTRADMLILRNKTSKVEVSSGNTSMDLIDILDYSEYHRVTNIK